MSEASIGTEIKDGVPQEKFNRRGLFKKAAAGAAAIGVTALGWQESQTIESGVQTTAGTFYPLYERHDQGFDERDLRDDLDACFLEDAGFFTKKEHKPIYDADPALVLYDWERGGTTKPPKELRTHKDQILEKIARNKTRIVFGDLKISETLIESDEEIMRKRRNVGILGATAYLFSEFSRQENSIRKVPRRKFLEQAGKVGLAIGVISALPLAGERIPRINDMDNRQKDTVSRIFLRLNGILHHLEPEDHVLFFRNLIMADKILTVAEAIKEKTNKGAKVAFNVGSGHTGMEDFLMVGHDFCRWLLSNYPPDFIANIAETNGGLESFCTARVLTLPSVADLGYPDLQLRYAEKLMMRAEEVPIKDERIIDKPLFQSLSARLK